MRIRRRKKKAVEED